MIFTHMIDIDEIVEFSQCQGHEVKGHIHGYMKKWLAYKTRTEDLILMKFKCMI